MLKLNRIIMIGAASKNAGKTEFACKLIEKFKDKYTVFGLKISTEHDPAESKHNLSGDAFLLTEETGEEAGKDTTRMLKAGAEKVYWLRTPVKNLEPGFMEFRKYLSGNELVICESNSLRRVVEPGFFMIMRIKGSQQVKPSCQAVWEYADCINDFEEHRFGIPVDRITYDDPDWEVNDGKK